jgi:transketolase
MFGFLPGVTTPGGATHQAVDDVAVMRVLPNMTVLETGDATEVESVLDVAHAIPGPVYVRQLRGEIPRLFDPSDAHGASRPYLMREYGLDALALVAQVEKLLGAHLDVGEDDLAAVRLEAVHSAAKAEAL